MNTPKFDENVDPIIDVEDVELDLYAEDLPERLNTSSAVITPDGGHSTLSTASTIGGSVGTFSSLSTMAD